jgi:hypothetical protein
MSTERDYLAEARLIAKGEIAIVEEWAHVAALAERVKVLEEALLQASFAIPTTHGVFEVVRAALAASTKGGR